MTEHETRGVSTQEIVIRGASAQDSEAIWPCTPTGGAVTTVGRSVVHVSTGMRSLIAGRCGASA